MRPFILMGDSFDPRHNLAVEETLFDTLPNDAIVFYLWQNQHTVVIGRHQNAWKECRTALLEEEGGILVRRSTGGGAVYHDLGNLNFSFVVPVESYDVHRQLDVIRAAAASFGVDTQFTGRNDLVITSSGAKFSGNAFRFSRTVGLHHGTIMIDVDKEKLGRYLAPGKAKLKAKNIESVRSRVENLSLHNPAVTVESMKPALVEAFEAVYGAPETMQMSDLPQAHLAELERKYASWDFRMGAAMPFDASFERRFEWGDLSLEFALRAGHIEDVQVHSDAMDEGMIGGIAPILKGLRYDGDTIAQALAASGNPMLTEAAEWIRSEIGR